MGDVPVFQSDVVFNTLRAASFRECMNEWSEPGKLEPKFGAQGRYDGDIKWYENVPQSEVKTLECTGGRGSFFPPIGRLMENFDVGPLRVLAACGEKKTQLSAETKRIRFRRQTATL